MFRIRRYSLEDREAVLQLADKHTSFDVEGMVHTDIEQLEAKTPFFFVAEDERGTVIGFIAGYEKKCVPERVLSKWKAKKMGYVDLMAVDEKHRRKGVGTALLNALLDRFHEIGIDSVDLDVPAEQEAAVTLYRKLGFNVRAYSMRKKLA